jgi:peptidoglycan/LPS O-acetylase OafA/YrhL
MKRIAEFEGLRGPLAYWVVLGHTSNALALDPPWPLPKNLSARSAVIVFIMLSGFVITHLLLEKRERYTTFLLRRFWRLFPGYAVCLFASVALLDVAATALELAPPTPATAGRLELVQAGLSQLGWHIAAHLSMLHGLLDHVLPSASYTLLGQAWSVSVEWQFYLVAPIILAALSSGRLHAVAALTVIAAALYASGGNRGSVLTAQAAPFALGIAYCHLWRGLTDGRTQWSVQQVRAFSLGVWLLSTLILDDRIALLVWCSVAHIVLLRAAASPDEFAATPEGTVARLLTGRAPQRLGAISYSVYLGHMLVLYPALLMLARMDVSPPVQAATLVAGVIFGTWLLAEAIYSWVERPGIRLGGWLATRWEAARPSVMAPSTPDGPG